MGRGIDFTSLTRAERIVLLAGTLGFVNGFVPWWFRTTNSAGKHFGYNAGLNGWSTLAVAAAALAAVAVLARAAIWPEPAPHKDGLLYTALGAVSVIAVTIQIAQHRSTWIGIYVASVFAVLLAFGGMRRRRERARGWT